jgi:hypothetical protein
MTWTCTECSATKDEAVQLLIRAGWWIGDRHRGLCPSCVRQVVETSGRESIRRARVLRDSARETLALVIEAVGDDPYGTENATRQ